MHHLDMASPTQHPSIITKPKQRIGKEFDHLQKQQ